MPGRELERWRPAEVVALADGRNVESFATLERRVAAELEAGLRSGDLRAYAEVFQRLLAHPAAETMTGIGARAYRHVPRVDPPAGVLAAWMAVLGAGMPASCYEMALRFAADHAHLPELKVAHGFVHEPEDQPLPWHHAWIELNSSVLWDPSTGLYLDRSDFYRVLGVVVAARYSPAEALEHFTATGSAKQWPATVAACRRLVDGFGECRSASSPSCGRGWTGCCRKTGASARSTTGWPARGGCIWCTSGLTCCATRSDGVAMFPAGRGRTSSTRPRQCGRAASGAQRATRRPAMGWSGASAGEKIAAAGQTAVAAGLVAAPVAGAVVVAKKLIEGGGAPSKAEEQAQARLNEERRRRAEQGQP